MSLIYDCHPCDSSAEMEDSFSAHQGWKSQLFTTYTTFMRVSTRVFNVVRAWVFFHLVQTLTHVRVYETWALTSLAFVNKDRFPLELGQLWTIAYFVGNS